MSRTLLAALNGKSVSAVLLAIGVGVACLPREGIDPEGIEAAAARPNPGCPPEFMGFRIPGPDAYPHKYMPWIRSRSDFIAHLTRGEDPAVVRRVRRGARGRADRIPRRGLQPSQEAVPRRGPGPSPVRPRVHRGRSRPVPSPARVIARRGDASSSRSVATAETVERR